MLHILAQLAPLKVSDGSRPVLRASSAQDRRLTGVAGLTWWPAIGRRPSIAIPLFDGDFTQDVAPGSASFTLRLDTLANGDIDAQTYRWAGAEVSLYAIDSEGGQDAAGSFDVADLDAVRIFKGRVESFSREGSGLAVTAAVDMEPFEKDVLGLTYAGTGDAEGGADLKGRLKPWILGRALNVEPVLVNSVENVVQFSAYPIQGISALYERGASLGASIGNYPTYAALVSATIPAGRWATCHALGMARLGAPPYGVITGDVDGDNGGGFVRTTGAIIQRIASVRGIATELIDVDSFAALDAAVPYNINIVLTEQTSVLDLVRRLVRPCNAQAGVDFLGRMFAVRPQIGTPSLTLDAQGRRLPPVRKCTEADVSPPYKRIMFGANRSWRIHTFDEIAFDSPLVDRGEYKGTETYRRGNIVSLPNGSRWLYVIDTPKAGSLPADGNADWELMTGAITAGNITYEDGTPVETLKPAEPGATVGATPAEQAQLAQLGIETAAAQAAIAQAQADIAEITGAIEGDFGPLMDAINALENEVDAAQVNISSLQSSNSAVQQSVSTLQGDVAAAQTAINTINLDVSAVEQSVANLTTSTAQDIGNLYSAVSTVQQDAAALQGSVSTLNGQVSGLQTQAAGIIGSIGQLGTEVDQIETTVSTQGGYITTLQQSVSNINGTVSTLSTTVSTQGGYISTLQQAVSTAEGSLATLRQEVNAGSNPNLLANGSGEQGNLSSWIIGFGDWYAATSNMWGTYFYLTPAGPVSGQTYFHMRHGLIPFSSGQYATAACDIDFYANGGVLAYSELRFLDAGQNVLASANSPGATPGRQFSATKANRPLMTATLFAPSGTAYAQHSVVVSAPQGATVTGFAFRQAKLEVGAVASAYTADASITQSFTAITTLDGNLASLVTRVGTAESSIVTNATAISTTNGNLASLSSTVSSQGGSISTLQSSVSTLSGTVSTLSSTVSTHGGQISSLQSVQSTQAGTIAQHTTDISTANANISTNAQAISTTNGNLASLSSTVSSQGGSITSLQSAVSTANGNIASLTTQVEAGVRPNLLINGTGEMGLDFWTSGYGNWTSNPYSSIWGNYFYVDNAGPSGQKFYHLIQWARFAPGHYASAAAEVDLYGGAGTRAYLAIRFCDEAYNILTEHSGASLYAPVAFSTSNNRKTLSFSTPQVAPPGTSRAAFLCIFYTPDGTSLTSAAFRRAKLEQGAVSTPYSADASVSQQWTAFSTLNTSFASLTTRVASAEGSVSTLQSSMTSANGSISSLQTSVSSLNGSVTTLQQSSSTQAGQISSLQSSVNTQGGQISTNAQAITTINGTLSQLNTTITASSNPNLLPNGGFENGLRGWAFFGSQSNTWIRQVWVWGQWAQANGFTGGGGYNHAYMENTPRLNVAGGNNYAMSFDYDMQGAGCSVYGEVVWWDSNGQYITQTGGPSGGPKSFDTTGTSRVKFSMTSPSNAAQATVRVVFYAPDGLNTGGLNARQIKFEFGSVATNYSGEATAGQMFTAYSDLNSSHASLSSTVSTQGGYITTLQSTTTTLSGTVATLSSTVATHGGSISSLQSVQSTMQGDVATLKTQVRTGGGNLLVNTDAATLVGWDYGNNGSNANFGINLPDGSWHPQSENTFTINQIDAVSSGYSEYAQYVAVIGGNWYDFSVLYGSHRCQIEMIGQWLDGNGSQISISTLGAQGPAGGGPFLGNFVPLSFKGQAPVTAARVRFYMRKYGTSSGSDSWAWFLRPQVKETTSTASSPVAYSPGSARAAIESQATAITTLNGSLATLTTRVSTAESSISQNATAISSTNGTLATLSSTVTAQGASIAQNATALSTLSSQYSSLSSTVSTLGATVSTQQTAISTLDGRTAAFFQVESVTPGGRAQLRVYSFANGGAGVDIIGDLGVSGNGIFGGTINPEALALQRFMKKINGGGTGSPAAGQSLLLYAVDLGQTLANGVYSIEFSGLLQMNVGRQTTSIGSKPSYVNVLADGGVRIIITKGGVTIADEIYTAQEYANTNSIAMRAASFSIVKVIDPDNDTTTGNVTVAIYAERGNMDTGTVDNGDYYQRDMSATYSSVTANAKVRWTFI